MLIARSVTLDRAAVGASELEVAALEARLGCKFPQAYREYLLWMGADDGGLLRGTDCFIGDVEANEQGLGRLLAENGLPPLPYRPVVFFLHQGYIACWFRMAGTAEDPEVLSFNEAEAGTGIRSLGHLLSLALCRAVGLGSGRLKIRCEAHEGA
jgi:hypothetical protein